MLRALVVLCLLAACQPQASTPTPEPLVLQTYAVPPGSGERVAAVLRHLFAGDTAAGRAEVAPDGSVVVLAARSTQAGVAELLGHVAEVHPPRDVAVDYWIVTGRPGASSRGAGLATLGPALDAIEKVDGPTAFELAEHRVVVSLDGESATSKSETLSIQQEASVGPGDVIVADVDLGDRDHGNQRTRLRLDPGAPLVLAQVGEGGESRYYVVSAGSR